MLFRSSHGTAPDIAGKGIANPIATILSVAMLLEWLPSGETREGAVLLRQAVERALADPAHATPDIGGRLTTTELADCVLAAL